MDALARAADLGVTTTSAHLQTLKQANLVQTRRAGTRVHYALAGDDVAHLYAQLRGVAQDHLADVEPARRAYLGLTGDEPIEEVTRDDLLRRSRADYDNSCCIFDHGRVRLPSDSEEIAGAHRRCPRTGGPRRGDHHSD